MAYQIKDLTHIQVPKGSSIITVVVHCTELNLSLNSIALHRELFGSEGKVIRMTQLSPDSWMLLGYRYDDGVPSAYTRESPTSLNTDRASTPLSDTAGSDTAGSDTDDLSDEDEAYEEDQGEIRSRVACRARQLRKGETLRRRRTRVPWLESDDQRLLSYKEKMGLKWEDVFDHFQDRTPGAVRLRYYTLRKKDS